VIQLSAFADEISPDLQQQIEVLRQEGIRHLELRSMWDRNVLDLTDAELDEIGTRLRSGGIGVSSLGSPIGKVAIDSDLDEHLRRFDRALEVARRCEAPFIRLFSFYPPADAERPVDWSPYRDTILDQLREMTRRATAADVTLLHENEKDIYGDLIERCVDLLRTVDSSHFRAAFDPANFVQCGQVPYPDGYEALRPWIAYVHVKDVDAQGNVTVAGEGVGRWPELLCRLAKDGYDGFFSLEPHLASGGQFRGFSGPELFRRASRSFQTLSREAFLG
jgi:sugar phosphate isomerase/epimerase